MVLARQHYMDSTTVITPCSTIGDNSLAVHGVIVGFGPNGIKLGKAKGRGYSKFRYLQFNNFAISTLFRA